MLTINNNSNYSPSFGVLKIANDEKTLEALNKCRLGVLGSIDQCGEKLKNTTYLDGLIKAVGDKLFFRVIVPRDFQFPPSKDEECIDIGNKLELKKNYNGNQIELGESYISSIGNSFLSKLRLTKAEENKDGTVEYNVGDCYSTTPEGEYQTVVNSLIFSQAERIAILDRAIQDIASGKIKLKNNAPYEPIMTETQIA